LNFLVKFSSPYCSGNMGYMIALVAIPVLAYSFYCMYMKKVKARCHCKMDLTGKTVIVTGSDKGIGYYTALDLARRNARVILACRNTSAAEVAAAEIRAQTGNSNVVVYKVDLSLLRSVRQFANEFNQKEQRLDVLVNNAGLAEVRNERTDEGLEVIFATNYIGPFLLTHLLLDKLKQSAPSRIVNVSSIGHKFFGPCDLSNLNAEKHFTKAEIYSYTKLQIILFTRELSRRLAGTGVTVNCLHPGTVNTNLFRRIPQPFALIISMISPFFFRTAEEGAQTSIHLAVSDKVAAISGEYFSECRLAKPAKYAQDDAVAKKLYELSEGYAQLSQSS